MLVVTNWSAQFNDLVTTVLFDKLMEICVIFILRSSGSRDFFLWTAVHTQLRRTGSRGVTSAISPAAKSLNKPSQLSILLLPSRPRSADVTRECKKLGLSLCLIMPLRLLSSEILKFEIGQEVLSFSLAPLAGLTLLKTMPLNGRSNVICTSMCRFPHMTSKSWILAMSAGRSVCHNKSFVLEERPPLLPPYCPPPPGNWAAQNGIDST